MFGGGGTAAGGMPFGMNVVPSVLQQGASEDRGETARMSAFVGALAVTDLVKTTLGPKVRFLSPVRRGGGIAWAVEVSAAVGCVPAVPVPQATADAHLSSPTQPLVTAGLFCLRRILGRGVPGWPCGRCRY